MHLDLSSKQVHLEGRDPISYDRLLIACGSKPRPPPWPGSELDGVGFFVTLRHLEWLQHEIYERATERPAVIGGGLLGMEVVEVSPPYDQSDITALAAAHVASDLLCVLRNRKLRGRRGR